MEPTAAAALALAVTVAGLGIWLGRTLARRQAEAFAAGVQRVVGAIAAAAAAERDEALRAAAVNGREEARARAAEREAACQAREAALDAGRERVVERGQRLSLEEARLEARRERQALLGQQVAARESELARLRQEAAAAEAEARVALERTASETAASTRAGVIEAEIDEARLRAAQIVRAAEHAPADEGGRGAKRVMGIAVGRFSGHYLTERLLSTLPIPAGAAGEALVGGDEAILRAIEAVAGVKLAVTEARDAIRLEGLDGVGREVARRCVARLVSRPGAPATPEAAAHLAREAAAALDRELADLGRRAFAALEIRAAHPEIVQLVGRLNYRTSYTQNQWKHAVEAGFLCGMMAEELGLDLKLARRAALMHDIGKALTHELDGSHAVIGADYARRLGEPEVVANAIGAHHTDEPFNSPYAYLVAAADAMSGARPGARRQTDENYVSRLEDLERITRSFPGIGEAFAVQGGREVRIYVREDAVNDLGAVDLSTAIARRISDEMRFPGQIRVTVIREFKAVEVAQ